MTDFTKQNSDEVSSAASVDRWGTKVWIDNAALKVHRIEVGPIHWPEDWDTWVEVDGVRHDVPSGQRVEIEPDTVTLKRLVR